MSSVIAADGLGLLVLGRRFVHTPVGLQIYLASGCRWKGGTWAWWRTSSLAELGRRGAHRLQGGSMI